MEADIANRPGPNSITLCRKSWVAYLSLVLAWVCLLTLAGVLVTVWDPWLTLLAALLPTLWLLYKWLLLRSVRLYYDDLGVWVYQGVLPWNRGLRGVKWRDMDESTFQTGFWPWVLRSFTLRISHRFTKDSEIVLTQMHQGQEVSRQINQLLMEKVQQQQLH